MGDGGKAANFCVPAYDPVYVSHNPEGRSYLHLTDQEGGARKG